MSKELEALKTLKDMLIGNGVNDNINKYVEELVEPIIKSLNRLEAIDNANPSEALECLEKIRRSYDETTTGMYGLGEVVVGNELEQYYSKELDTIKQALLKVQEPKHYLKWEDLKFTAKEQTINVLLNGEKYFVKYRLGYLFGYYETVEITTKGCVLCTLGNLMIQFFNDLHLEVVEE